MKPIHYDDALRARDWGLEASFLESKMDSSVLVCLCQAMVEAKGFGDHEKALLDWALLTGARMKLLADNSALFFQMASLPGASWLWRRLLDNGYTLDKVVAKVTNTGVPGAMASRVTSKLGLLCSTPYCLTLELPELIALLIERGSDPNERDSDGYAPLGRLNEQLRQHEESSLSINAFVPVLVAGVSVLLECGAEIEGLLPIPEVFAAKCIQECVKSRREKTELLQQVVVPHIDMPRPRKASLSL